ncbi:MAG TPA: hypothetical protein PKK06_17015 [Phycisphaerae bacterium]|nr:hypothetical protein [Phycisphaerae bacterium]HNU46225.1 hypothetical protein [Phycisphaerae bacterium]
MTEEGLGRSLAGKVVTAIVGVASVVACVGAGIWFWRHPEDLAAIWRVVKYALAWAGFVLVLPWATFFIPRWVLTKDSNLASGLMLGGYLVADVAVGLWLMGGMFGHSTLTWVVVVAGFLAAGVYNYASAEYLTSLFEDETGGL